LSSTKRDSPSARVHSWSFGNTWSVIFMEELGWELRGEVEHCTITLCLLQTDTNRLVGHTADSQGCTCPSSLPTLLTQKMVMLAESSASSCLTSSFSEGLEAFTLRGQYNMSPRWHLTASLISWTIGSSFSQRVLGTGFSRPF